MNTLRGEAFRGNERAGVFELAEQLVDSPGQLEIYDQAKWNLLGHADRAKRFEGHYPWLKRRDTRGIERTMSVPVFSGYSPETDTVMVVRKDPWTHHADPETWLVAEQSLVNGSYMEPKVLSVNVDASRRLWLQLAPKNYGNWPRGYHPTLHARPYDQIRLTGRLDSAYHLQQAEYQAGQYGDRVHYEDIEALESMIIAVQQLRWAAAERAAMERSAAEELGIRTIAALESLPMAS